MGCDDAARDALNDGVIPVVVGPVCCAAGVDLGIVAPHVPDRYRIGPMIRMLTDELIANGRRMSIGGVPATITGGELRLEGQVVPLSGKESALLAVLLEAAPKVVSRQVLLERVWDSGTDSHVVDVTIGRLRRRLGLLGDSIVAVPRRGYSVRP
jgi:uroporphyrinogen-III synthase